MAGLTKGTTISFGDTVTAQTLHNLIEAALISGIQQTDLNDGVHFISVGTATPNPSLFPLWYNTDPEDPVLRIFATPWDVWLTVGPDRFEVPLTNNGVDDITRGMIVAGCNPSECYIATNVSINAIGFAQDDIAVGSVGPVAIYGIGDVMHGTSESNAAVVSGGSGLSTFGCIAGGVAPVGLDGNGGSGPLFGMFLQGPRSGASGSGGVFKALIWGPTITHVPAGGL
jgi:hypothetical protein